MYEGPYREEFWSEYKELKIQQREVRERLEDIEQIFPDFAKEAIANGKV